MQVFPILHLSSVAVPVCILPILFSEATVVLLLTCLLMSILNQIARPIGNNFPGYLFVS